MVQRHSEKIAPGGKGGGKFAASGGGSSPNGQDT